MYCNPCSIPTESCCCCSKCPERTENLILECFGFRKLPAYTKVPTTTTADEDNWLAVVIGHSDLEAQLSATIFCIDQNDGIDQSDEIDQHDEIDQQVDIDQQDGIYDTWPVLIDEIEPQPEEDITAAFLFALDPCNQG